MGDVREHRGRQPFREHVVELRKAITFSLLVVFIGSCIGYALYKPLFALLLKPYNSQLYFTTPAGAFNAIFKVSILFGLILAIPFIVQRVFKFIAPAFPRRIQYFTAKLLLLSAFFAFVGVSFGYFVSLPTTLHFLTHVGPDNIKPLIEVSSYLNFVFHYLFGLALIFQFPLILLIINKISPLKPGGLMKYQRHVIAGSTVVAAIITPTTDPINMALLTAPLIILYQIGLVFVWLANRGRATAVMPSRPKGIEPVAINPIPSNFGIDEKLEILPEPIVISTPNIDVIDYELVDLIDRPEPVISEPIVPEIVAATARPLARVVNIQAIEDSGSRIAINIQKSRRLIPIIQSYAVTPITVNILPPTASA